MPSQSSLLKEIRTAFAQEPRINKHQSTIALTCHNGTLMVSGAVETIAAKKLALAHARTVYGIFTPSINCRSHPPRTQAMVPSGTHSTAI